MYSKLLTIIKAGHAEALRLLVDRLLLSVVFILLACSCSVNNLKSDSIEKEYADAKRYPPSLAYQYYLKAKAFEQDKKTDRAIDFLRLAIAQDSKSAKLKFDLAVLLLNQNKLDAAEKQLYKAYKSDPKYTQAVSLLGEIAFFKNQFDQALVNYNKVLLLDESNRQAIVRIGDIIFMQKGPASAISFFENRKQKDPYNLYVLAKLVKLYYMQKDFERVRENLIALLRFDPEEAKVLDDLTKWYIKSEKFDSGIEFLLDIKNNVPPTPLIPLKLGRLCLAAKDTMRAKSYFDEAIAYDVWDNSIATEVGFAYLDYEYPLLAAEVFKKLSSDNNSTSLFLEGHAFLKAEQYDKAIELFTRIESNEYYYIFAQTGYALALYKMGHHKKAQRKIETILEQNPFNWHMYGVIAEYYKNTNNLDKAIEVMKEGLNIFAGDSDLLFDLAQYYEMNKQTLKAVETMNEILKVDRYNADALNFVGYSYTQLKINLVEAEIMLKRAIALKPGESYIIDSLGWIYFLTGQLDKSLQWLYLATMLDPYEPEILYHYALVLKELNKTAEMEIIVNRISALVDENHKLHEKCRKSFPSFGKKTTVNSN